METALIFFAGVITGVLGLLAVFRWLAKNPEEEAARQYRIDHGLE